MFRNKGSAILKSPLNSPKRTASKNSFSNKSISEDLTKGVLLGGYTQAEGRIEVAHGGYRGYGGRRRWKAKKTGPAGQGPVPRWRFATKRRWRRSERVADAQVHTARAGIGNTRGAADQADAGTVLVADVRHTSVQRGALGQVVDISDRILVGLAAAAREGRGVAAELGAGVLDAEAARARRDGGAQVEPVYLAGSCAADGFPLQTVVSAIEREAAEVVRSAQCQVVQVAGCGNGAGGAGATLQAVGGRAQRRHDGAGRHLLCPVRAVHQPGQGVRRQPRGHHRRGLHHRRPRHAVGAGAGRGGALPYRSAACPTAASGLDVARLPAPASRTSIA